jgi:hypothetical protein
MALLAYPTPPQNPIEAAIFGNRYIVIHLIVPTLTSTSGCIAHRGANKAMQ